MNPTTLLMLVFLVAGAAIIGLNVPLMRGRVGPNSAYGFRVRRTIENPEIWYPVNAYAARRGMWLGAAIIVAAVVLDFVPGLGVGLYSGLVGAVALVGLAIVLVQTFGYLGRLTKEKPAAEGEA